jgi:hypothetical protein
MTSHPRSQTIPRSHTTRPPGNPELPAASWTELERLLSDEPGTTWLSVPGPQGAHVRPLIAAWTGTTFVFASKASAAKSRRLDADSQCSLAIDLGVAHLVVEGIAARLTGATDLARAADAMRDVYDWPTTVVGDELDAPYAAPSSGGPPFRAYEVTPTRAFAFPTNDEFDPTRFTFD